MLDATIEAHIVQASSIIDCRFPLLDRKTGSGRQVQARILVPSPWIFNGTFEEVHYCFAGELRTRLGSNTNKETLICLTDTQSSERFRPCTTAPGDPYPCHYLDLNFHIPSRETLSYVSGGADVSDLPPSTSFSGSTYLAQQTALSDRHLVQGTCEVAYRVQAQFCRGQQLIRELSMPITLLPGPRLALKCPRLLDIAVPPKFHMRKIWKSPPILSLDLFDTHNTHAMPIRHDFRTQHKSTSMPFTVKLGHVDPDADALQSIRCTVEARWCTRRSFATTKLNNTHSSSQQVDQVSRSTWQVRVVYLPPLWPTEAPDRADKTHTYAATADVVLSVPDSVAGPTIRCGLLSETYTLELYFCFEIGQDIPRYIIKRTIPAQVYEPGVEMLSKSLLSGLDDFGVVESDVTTPPPSYVELST